MNSIEPLPRYPKEEHLPPGHLACPGCGMAVALRAVLKTLGQDVILAFPPGCTSVVLNMKVRKLSTPFDTVASTAAGMKIARELCGDTETTVLVWAGDGATFDAGLLGLSACAERNEDILYVCYDNEGYMNTGNQRSSATPWGAMTYTTPAPGRKVEEKKNIVELIVAHYVPYAATASIAYMEDLIAKVARAKALKGFRFIHLHSPCPTGWGSPAERSIELARLAVETRIFPLYEVEDGEWYTINLRPERVQVETYFEQQGRYRGLTREDVAQLQARVDRRWKSLLIKAEVTGNKEAGPDTFR